MDTKDKFFKTEILIPPELYHYEKHSAKNLNFYFRGVTAELQIFGHNFHKYRKLGKFTKITLRLRHFQTNFDQWKTLTDFN